MEGDLDFGRSGGDGSLAIEGGGSVSSHRASIGHEPDATGAVTVSGPDSTWTIPPRDQDNTNELYVGRQGSGTLAIGAGGQVNVAGGNGTVILAGSGNASGTLYIGAPEGEAPVAAGRLNAATVVGGSGTGGAKLVFNHTSSFYFFSRDGQPNSGILISGSTAVEHRGPGVTVLTRENNYTGGTTISDGTLMLYNNGWITGDVVNDGTLAFQRTGPRNFGGNISGTGSVIHFGQGSIITLTGDNSYSGGTIVVDGTLRAGSLNAFVDNTAYTVNNGTLDLNISLSLTMSSLSGTGGLVDIGSTELTIDQAGDTSFAGAIIGFGTLTKAGAGTLTLSGTNTYSGNTAVNGGTLEVEGAIANSTITVATGGTLGGSGSVASVDVNGGAIAPGSGLGTLTVNGLLSLDADSQLEFELGGLTGAKDRIAVDGDLVLDGTLDVTDLGGFQQGSYTLLTYTGDLTDNGLTLGALPAGFEYSVEASSLGSIVLRVTESFSADFDNDGDVDGDDLTEWQAAYGVNSLADADGDNDSDGADFLAWQRQFGSGVESGLSSSAPVPEPSGLVLLTALLAPHLADWRRRGA